MNAVALAPAAVGVYAAALTRAYGSGESAVHALRGVSLEIPAASSSASPWRGH